MRPEIGYIILDHNPLNDEQANDAFIKCVTSLYERKNPNIKTDIYLFDQSNNIEHEKLVYNLRSKCGFSVILMNRNLGISRALNYFARLNKAPIMGFITSDIIVITGFDIDLLDKLKDPEIFQIAPLVSKSELMWQSLLQDEKLILFGSDNWVRPINGGLVRTIGSELNLLFIKMSTFDKIGYFDERWKVCYENNDFFLRGFMAGGCTAISYDSFIWHYHQMGMKSGARDHSYDDYIDIKHQLWQEKWSDVMSFIDLYAPLGSKTIRDFPLLLDKYRHNIYLDYNQEMFY